MLEQIVGRVRRNLVAIVIAIVALGGSTLAVAANRTSTGGNTRIYACATAKFRTLNLSSASARCPEGQRKISWSSTGKKGARGAKGSRGARGAAGAQGAAGVAGASGPQGPVGADGSSGPQGPVGADGSSGPQGPAGADGSAGPQGGPGPQGPAGPAGPAGPVGVDGPQGPAGQSGAQHVMQTGLASTAVIGPESRAVVGGWGTPSVETLSGFDPSAGTFTAPEAGTYRVAYDATAGPSSAVTVSTGSDTWLALILERNAIELLERRFPVLDVNVGLVLTMRVPLRESSVSGERHVTLAAGDVLRLRMKNDYTVEVTLAASLSITKVS